jgi:hypothetical protein
MVPEGHKKNAAPKTVEATAVGACREMGRRGAGQMVQSGAVNDQAQENVEVEAPCKGGARHR